MLHEQIHTLEGQSLNLASLETGRPPLLFLHGVTRRWQDFLSLMVPPLTLRWSLHALDQRGHGRSGRANRYAVVDFVSDAVALVRQRFREPVVLYGHSLGALVAAGVAAAAPDLIRAVILEDPPSEGFLRSLPGTTLHHYFAVQKTFAGSHLPIQEVAQQLGDVLISPHPGAPARPLRNFRDITSLRFSARCLREVDPEVLMTLLQDHWLEGYSLEAALKAIRAPVLLLAGDEDVGGMLPRQDAERLAQSCTEGALVRLPGVGHLIHGTQTETTLRLLVGFLESLEGDV